MNFNYSRRQFLKRSTLAAGALALAPTGMLRAQSATRRSAVDEVTLGRTGIKLSRLGMGTGSSGGQVQKALGQAEFNRLIHYAYEQGIRYFDCAESYATFPWIADAIKGLPREKLFLQSKIGRQTTDVLAAIDRHRQTFNTDYIDSMLVHCMVKNGWTDDWKRMMDGFDQAREKKWIQGQRRLLPQSARFAHRHCLRMDRGPFGARQSPGPPGGRDGRGWLGQYRSGPRHYSRAGRD